MLDNVMLLTAIVLRWIDVIVLTLQFRISYMAPTLVERVISLGEILRPSATGIFMQIFFAKMKVRWCQW